MPVSRRTGSRAAIRPASRACDRCPQTAAPNPDRGEHCVPARKRRGGPAVDGGIRLLHARWRTPANNVEGCVPWSLAIPSPVAHAGVAEGGTLEAHDIVSTRSGLSAGYFVIHLRASA